LKSIEKTSQHQNENIERESISLYQLILKSVLSPLSSFPIKSSNISKRVMKNGNCYKFRYLAYSPYPLEVNKSLRASSKAVKA